MGATLLATIQRGQEVDKSMMNNATYLYICQHTTDDDAKYMARKIGIPTDIVPRIPMRFLIWTPAKGLLVQGKTEYRKNGKPVVNMVKGAKPVFIPAHDKRKRLMPSATLGLFNRLQYR